MNKEEQLSRLLRLKRHETPDPDYFRNFVGEFHRYLERTPPTSQGWMAGWAAKGAGLLAALRQPPVAWAAAGSCAVILFVIANHSGDPHLRGGPVADGQPSIVGPRELPGVPAGREGTRGSSIPSEQTVPVSSTPSLVPPAPGKRRTADQPEAVTPMEGQPVPAPLPRAR